MFMLLLEVVFVFSVIIPFVFIGVAHMRLFYNAYFKRYKSVVSNVFFS